jgi:hypothetical protein
MTQAHPPITITNKKLDLDKAKRELPEKYFQVFKTIYESTKQKPKVIFSEKINFSEIVTEKEQRFILLDSYQDDDLEVGDAISYSSTEIIEGKNSITFVEFLRIIQAIKVGQPSTYGFLLEKLFVGEKAYLEIKNDKVIHTKLGHDIYESLIKNNRPISSHLFSLELETALDDIAQGTSLPVDVLTKFLSIYYKQKIESFEVDFNLDSHLPGSLAQSSELESVFGIIPQDHILQGIKLAADEILVNRKDEFSNSSYKLKILYDFFDIRSIDILRDRLYFDILFRWFCDLKMDAVIPTKSELSEYIFSEHALSFENIKNTL